MTKLTLLPTAQMTSLQAYLQSALDNITAMEQLTTDDIGEKHHMIVLHNTLREVTASDSSVIVSLINKLCATGENVSVVIIEDVITPSMMNLEFMKNSDTRLCFNSNSETSQIMLKTDVATILSDNFQFYTYYGDELIKCLIPDVGIEELEGHLKHVVNSR